MVDEKKHSETAMGEPVSAREKTAQNADEVAMGRPTAPKDIDARSDAQVARACDGRRDGGEKAEDVAMGQPATNSNGRSRRSTRRRWGSRRTDPS